MMICDCCLPRARRWAERVLKPRCAIMINRLLIAKFPHPGDETNQPAWEALALRLASSAGINASEGRLETVADRSVLLLSRFDRVGTRRIPFLSAMSLLGASDNESHSYLEIADALRQSQRSAR